MRSLLVALLALQPATVVYVMQYDAQVNVGVQIGDVIYSAEFPRRVLKPENLIEGGQVQAEVKGGQLTVQLGNGRKATARITQEQRIHPHPAPR